MGEVSNRVWGESAAADAVRELVVGIAPSQAGKRLLVAFQAYIDDSRTDGSTFVLAGHVASADAWEAFSRDWEEMLPQGLRDRDGYYFKMSEMAALDERMERVPGFYRIIERHVLFSISCRIGVDELERARRRIFVPHKSKSGGVAIDWGAWFNPYTVAFRGLLDMFNNNREVIEEILPSDEPVDFIFDEQLHEKRELLEGWDDLMESRDPSVRDRYGQTPIFRDDRKFLPLQGADLWAWWVRKWYDEGTPEMMEEPDFGFWKANRDSHVKFAIEFDEDALVDSLLSVAADHLRQDHVAMDLGCKDGMKFRQGNGKKWREAVAAFDPRRMRS